MTASGRPAPAGTSPSRPGDRVVRQAFRLALGTASALGLARFAYGLLLPGMRDDLGWSLAEAGAMTTANGVGYLIGAMAAPVLSRRLGTATAFRLGMVLTALALAATAASGVYPVQLVTRAAAGFTGALALITGGVIASRLSARTGSSTPITVYFAGTGVGIALSGAALPPLVEGHAERWPIAWIGLAAVAGLTAATSWTAAGRAGAAGEPTPSQGRAHIRPLWRIAAAYMLFAAGYISYITFLSAYLADRDASAPEIALIWTLLGLAVVAAPLLWNRPITVWPGSRALATALALLAAAAALALPSAAPPVVIASAIAYGATFMNIPAAVTARIRATTPPPDWTATLAAFTTLFAVGQIAGPWISGAIADHTTTAAPLAWTAILCGIGAALAATDRSR